MEITLSNKLLREMGVKEVEQFIAQSKQDGLNVASIERWLAVEKGEEPKQKRLPTTDVLAYKKGDAVSWRHKRKDYVGTVYKLNTVTVGVEEHDFAKSQWNIAPCYLTKQ